MSSNEPTVQWYSFSWWGASFRIDPPPKKRVLTVVVICAVSYRRNIVLATNMAQLGVNFGQQNPNSTWIHSVPTRYQFGPKWRNFTPSCTHLGATANMGALPAQHEIIKERVFAGIVPFFWHRRSCAFSNVPCVVPGLCPTWREAATGCHQTSKLRQVEAMICRWVALDPSSAST